MPDRYIRERARRSPTLQRLSDAAERAWWRLTVTFDDYGRFEADPTLLLAQLFERRPAGWTEAKIRKVLAEWEDPTDPLIHRYQVADDPRVYGHALTAKTWQRERESKPKYPDPPCKGKSYPQESTPCTKSLRFEENPRQTKDAASRGRSPQFAAPSVSESVSVSVSVSDARAAIRGNQPTESEPGVSRPQGSDGLGYDPTDPVALKARAAELRRAKGFREPEHIGPTTRAVAASLGRSPEGAA